MWNKSIADIDDDVPYFFYVTFKMQVRSNDNIDVMMMIGSVKREMNF